LAAQRLRGRSQPLPNNPIEYDTVAS